MTPALRPAPDPEPPETTDDTALLARLGKEPGRAIGDVVRRFERPLLKYARALVGSDAAAQDVVQEAFVRLLRKVSSVRSLSAWLGRVTHNLAMDHLRREARMRKLHVAAVAERGPAVVVVDHDPSRREVAQTLERGLQALSGNERAVIVLKVVEGKSYKEISAITGLSTSNVGYLIHHGLKKMAAQLEAAGAFRGGVR
jgi:RNA polymerase sigma-70 factor (ECF subfamily)